MALAAFGDSAETLDCYCEEVHYMHPLDGGCWHKACLGDLSGDCGSIISGTPTSEARCSHTWPIES